VLKLENVSVSYGRSPALFGVSLEVAAGEVVALLGSNGAGKSSTLKAISGLVAPTSGEITLDGRRIDGKDSHEVVNLGVAHSPEGRRLFPGLTVLENLKLGAVSKESRAVQQHTLDEVFQMFPVLSERRKQQAGLLSGGEQQMCAIGRALMAKPRLLLLDEPSLGLAPRIISEVFQVVRTVRDKGVTVLLVEQNVAQSLHLADRAYVIERGRVALEGKAADLLEDKELQRAYLGA
jgi:branched-chain amino acid transport system ATP-binding protein